FHYSLLVIFVLTTRHPWSTSVLNRNTLPTIHDTELIRLTTQ
ncbi:hypothetical protein A2U01_0088493, partial [Trifolium medium]|nr:hypothetical protein [Trifolium medium]